MDRRWNKNTVSLLSSVTSVIRLPISLIIIIIIIMRTGVRNGGASADRSMVSPHAAGLRTQRDPAGRPNYCPHGLDPAAAARLGQRAPQFPPIVFAPAH